MIAAPQKWHGKKTIPAALLQAHYDEVAAYKGQFKLNPDWERYDELNQQGKFGYVHALTERAFEVVGYLAFVCEPHLHYKDTIVAIGDVHYVMPEWRHLGVGTKLIKAAEDHAIFGWRAKFFVLRHKVDHPHGDLYTQMGYKPIDTVYLKEL